MTGRILLGNEAASIGLVNYCEDNPEEKAMELSKLIQKKVFYSVCWVLETFADFRGHWQ